VLLKLPITPAFCGSEIWWLVLSRLIIQGSFEMLKKKC
jgi:hypothetical protein